jgi:hypothetical protein
LRHGLTVARAPSVRLSWVIELIARFIVRRLGKGEEGEGKQDDEIEQRVKKLEAAISVLISFGSVVVSFYTGLSGLLGKGG